MTGSRGPGLTPGCRGRPPKSPVENSGSQRVSTIYTAGRVRRHNCGLGALMRPRKAKPLPQGSYGQRSPRRVTESPSNGGGRRVAANRPHRPCSVAPTIMVTVLPACLGRQGRHVVTSRPHAVSMTEPSQVRRLSSEIVPLCR
ncbi:hypothetical protein PCANC_19480 [Puccinia coronata f. sp. avenae]|uniref:Uncharacterized protein n=1 Tax=Puccinia coronata f. sp. avenae TaxID=200324 RepID=A0A2N5U910_9BASI|nr:hypothetical protein PCANC_19480 [Puccinia coronata f. sp. avenae]